MDTHDLLMTAARAAIVYVVMLTVIRLLGKREVGNITAFDFLVALMLGEVVDEIIFGDVTMVKGFIAVLAVALLHYANSWASFRSKFMDRLTASEPTVLIRDGKVIEHALAKERMNRGELESELRLMGIEDISDVRLATLETTGQVSVLKQPWAKELEKGDLEKVLARF